MAEKRRRGTWGCGMCVSGIFLAAMGLGLVEGRASTLVMNKDSRAAYLVEPFCFSPGGTVNFNVENFELNQGEKRVPANGKVGFLVRHVDDAMSESSDIVDVAGQSCLLSPMADEKDMNEAKVLLNGPNRTFSMDVKPGRDGLYSILFANCVPGSSASYSLHLSLMNPGNVYLSAGDVPLPYCYAAAGAAFAVALVVWICAIRSKKEGVMKIHYLMAMLCGVKAASVLLEAVKVHVVMLTGDASGWAAAVYVAAFVKGTLLFSVILLIGSGWSFIKPFLNERDKRIIMVVLPLQVVVNIAMVVVEETPPGTMGWLTWRDVLHLFDIICCCAILFPIVWSISYLKESSEADGKSQRSLAKLRLFREFYVMVFAYVYFTRIIVYLVRATMPCKYGWVSKLTSEAATLAFFVVAGFKFRPRHDNPYLKVEEEEDGKEMYETEQAEEP